MDCTGNRIAQRLQLGGARLGPECLGALLRFGLGGGGAVEGSQLGRQIGPRGRNVAGVGRGAEGDRSRGACGGIARRTRTRARRGDVEVCRGDRLRRGHSVETGLVDLRRRGPALRNRQGHSGLQVGVTGRRDVRLGDPQLLALGIGRTEWRPSLLSVPRGDRDGGGTVVGAVHGARGESRACEPLLELANIRAARAGADVPVHRLRPLQHEHGPTGHRHGKGSLAEPGTPPGRLGDDVAARLQGG